MNTLGNTNRLLNAAFLAGSLLMNSASLHAVPITGILNTTGSVAVTSTTIDFLPAGTGTGDFGVDPFTQTGSFSGLAGTSETHQNLKRWLAPINGGVWVSATYSANFIGRRSRPRHDHVHAR